MLYRSKTTQSFLNRATSEFNNYSVGTSEGGLNWLLDHASARVPELKNSRVLKEWSGVRPYTREVIELKAKFYYLKTMN